MPTLSTAARILALFLALLSSPAAASTGKISGTVLDAQTGAPLPDANVVLVGLKKGTVADAEGRFFILNLAPDFYALSVSYIGYQPLIVEELRVSADLTTRAELRLEPDDVAVEAVVVRAERPIIDKNATCADKPDA